MINLKIVKFIFIYELFYFLKCFIVVYRSNIYKKIQVIQKMIKRKVEIFLILLVRCIKKCEKQLYFFNLGEYEYIESFISI